MWLWYFIWQIALALNIFQLEIVTRLILDALLIETSEKK